MLEVTDRILNLPRAFVKKYKDRGFPLRVLEAMEDECRWVLIRGLIHYDPSKDVRANGDRAGETYLYKCMFSAVKNFFRTNLKKINIERQLRFSGEEDNGKRRAMFVTEPVDRGSTRFVKDLENKELVRMLKAQMAPHLWRTLWGCLGEGLTHVEVAAKEGVTKQCICRRLLTARKRAQTLLARANLNLFNCP